LSVHRSDAERLVLLLNDGSRRDGQHVAVLLDNDGSVGVEPWAEFAAWVGDVDLDADGPRLRVQRPRGPCDLPLDGPALHRLELAAERVPLVDVGRAGF